MHTRTEGNEHLLNLKEKENMKIIEKLEKKITSRDNLIKVYNIVIFFNKFKGAN